MSYDMMRFVSYRDKLSLVPGNIGHQRGGNRKSVWFVTEYGLYEICMRSSKPIAIDFRHSVKELLYDIRIKGTQYLEQLFNNESDPLINEWETINYERELNDEEFITWEDFLRSKGYTEDMID